MNQQPLEILEEESENYEEEEQTLERSSAGTGLFSYIIWFLLFFFLTSAVFGFGTALVIHGLGVLFAFTLGERVFRFLSGWREVRTRKEKEKLLPILESALDMATEQAENLKKRGIELFILEDLSVNAAAMGTKSVMITQGAFLLLSEEQITGVFLHELGHIAHNDSRISLLFECFNWPWTIIFKIIDRITVRVDNSKFLFGSSPVTFLWAPFKWLSIILQNLTSFVLARSKRRQEYEADRFAFVCGYGDGLISLLYELDMLSNSEQRKIKQYLMATHPPMTKRIQALEEGCVRKRSLWDRMSDISSIDDILEEYDYVEDDDMPEEE